MDSLEWIWAAIAVGGGLLAGEIAGRLARRVVQGRDSGASRRELAGVVGTFMFWLATGTGLVFAIQIVDAEVLDDLRDKLSETVPSVGVAALVLIGGWAISIALAAMVGQSARKATGVRQPGLERVLQLSIMGGAVVVALAALGVQASLIVVPLAVVIGAPALAFALLSGLGGREVASQLAAGRTLRHQLREGHVLSCGEVRGRIVALHSTTVEVECSDGSRAHIPNRWMLEQPFSVSD